MVATTALGLGVDFREVVLVVCVLAYKPIEMLQMFGRAGRDGSPATVVLLAPRAGLKGWFAEYANGCRRRAVSNYLDEIDTMCDYDDNPCDVCSAGTEVQTKIPTTVTPVFDRLGLSGGSSSAYRFGVKTVATMSTDTDASPFDYNTSPTRRVGEPCNAAGSSSASAGLSPTGSPVETSPFGSKQVFESPTKKPRRAVIEVNQSW
jgi:hypothetical protein